MTRLEYRRRGHIGSSSPVVPVRNLAPIGTSEHNLARHGKDLGFLIARQPEQLPLAIQLLEEHVDRNQSRASDLRAGGLDNFHKNVPNWEATSSVSRTALIWGPF